MHQSAIFAGEDYEKIQNNPPRQRVLTISFTADHAKLMFVAIILLFQGRHSGVAGGCHGEGTVGSAVIDRLFCIAKNPIEMTAGFHIKKITIRQWLVAD
jgi:hypothetical protein